MAAIDMRGITIFPHYRKITVGTAAQEIQIPDQCDQVEIANWDSANDLYIGQNGQSDGGTWAGNYQFPIPAKQPKAIPMGRGPARAGSIYVAASLNTIDVYIELSDK